MASIAMKELWDEIERLRDKFHNTASKKGIRSAEAIRASRRFNDKINEYYRLGK